MKISLFAAAIHLIITSIVIQSFANEICGDLLNPPAYLKIIKTAESVSTQYTTEEMEELLMDTAHQRKSPDIFDPKDIEALQAALSIHGLIELLKHAVSYPYNAEYARRRGEDFPQDEDFALLSEGLLPTPPSQSELSELPDRFFRLGNHGAKEANLFFWDQIEQQFAVPIRLSTSLERIESVEDHNGTLDFIKQSAGFFSIFGSLNDTKVHWTFISLIRARLVRELVEDMMANGGLNWSTFSSIKIDRAILLAAAYPELITLLDLFPEMHWMLTAWEIENSGTVPTASKKIKGLSDHIAEFYIKKELDFIEVEESMGDTVVRFPSPIPFSNDSKVLSESIEEASITVSPVTVDDNIIPRMSEDDERQSMWIVTSAWRAFARENELDYDAVLITTGTDPFGFYDDTETIKISINQAKSNTITIRQLALFYLELTEGEPVSYRGEAWRD